MRLLCLVSCLVTCGFSWGAIHRYAIEIDEGLRRVAVEARLAAPGLELAARRANGEELRELATCGGQPLEVFDKRIRLPADDACVRYDAPLSRSRHSRRLRLESSQAALSAPGRWLWLPKLGRDDQVVVDVALPAGLSGSFPWTRVGAHEYRFGRSPRSGLGLAVIGEFIELDMDHTGISKPVAFLGPERHANKVRSWLDAAAIGLGGIGGRVPNAQVQVIVMPVDRGRGRSPVPFGRVVRDHGESVHFFVDLQQSEARYLEDWTAPHEFAHTLLPHVDAQWVSEGFAGYYQNLILARGGQYSENEAWRRLVNSFRRAAALKNPPSPNGSRDRPFWEVRLLLYWSGAALALMADAEIRATSGGERSLDTVLAGLARCCLPSTRTWRAQEVFAVLDEHGGNGILTRLYARHADTPGMPDTGEVLRKLGVERAGSSVELVDNAPWAPIRRAIMGASQPR